MKSITFFSSHGARPQRGAVLLISLIILAVLLAAGAALVRSFDTSMFQAGNLAFRRDLANQAGRVTPIIQGYLNITNGALRSANLRSNNVQGANYSATMLPSNDQGIPTALLSNNFETLPIVRAGNTINNIVIDGVNQQVTIRYLIDRMCMTTGDETTLGDRCIGVNYEDEAGCGGGASGGCARNLTLRQVSFRVSIRVDGPRNTQAFFQSVMSL